MAKRISRKAKRAKRIRFWSLVILSSVLAAFCILVTLSGRLKNPFLPTWQELFEMVGLSSGAPGEPLDSELEVHVIDVGNADSLLIRNGSHAMLIDAGERDDGETVVSYLRAHGVEKLEMVIATHADADHIGGMKTVIEALPVEAFLMAYMPEGSTPTTSTYLRLLEALDDKGIAITEASPGASYPLGEARVDILGPAADFEEKNNQSVVCKVTFGSRKFLFMGDAEKEAEAALLESGADLSADVLKTGHHGSSSSTTAKLLTAVHPAGAFITCGAGNSYGHPHKAVLDRLEEAGVRAFRSDVHGTIVAVTDGQSLSFTTEKGGAAA